MTEDRDPVAHWSQPPDDDPNWALGRVRQIVPEAPDAVTLRVSLEQGVEFSPGQYFLIRVRTAGGRLAQRAFSAASSPYPPGDEIELTVKEEGGGEVSPILVRRVPVGAVFQWRGPVGYFTWNEADGGPLLLVGAGSGVVPLMGIIRYAVARELSFPMRLLASSTDRDHALYRAQLDQLVAEHPWLTVTHTFTRSPRDRLAAYHRHIDAAMIDDLLPTDRARAAVYLCGPSDLVTELDAVVRELGVGDVFTDAWE